jgi:SOS response regulatory protein OraA/RecX
MEEWMDRLRKWSSMQERCPSDARKKVIQWGGSELQAERAIARMEEENFISKERYIEAYLRVHVQHKKWGPNRVFSGLRSKGISASEAQKAVRDIPRDDVLDALNGLVERRASELPERRDRVVRFLLGKGYNLQDILDSLAALTSR